MQNSLLYIAVILLGISNIMMIVKVIALEAFIYKANNMVLIDEFLKGNKKMNVFILDLDMEKSAQKKPTWTNRKKPDWWEV